MATVCGPMPANAMRSVGLLRRQLHRRTDALAAPLRTHRLTDNDGRSFSKRSDPEVGAYGVAPFRNLLAILAQHPESGEELCMRHHPLEAADQVSHVRGFRGRAEV